LSPNASSGSLISEPGKDQPSFLVLAPNRGLPSQHLSILLVRSYRTFAPLPVRDRAIGGMFLWHFPRGCPHWALPSKFGLSGVRTFLRWGDFPTSATASPTFSLICIIPDGTAIALRRKPSEQLPHRQSLRSNSKFVLGLEKFGGKKIYTPNFSQNSKLRIQN